MLGNILKNKLAIQASKKPVTYYIEPKIRSRINVFDISNDIDAKFVEQSILDYKDKFPISNQSNVQAWHSNWHIHHDTNAFDNLIKVVEDRVLNSLDQTNLRLVECVESWAIVYRKGNKTHRHKHSDQQYSAVYYAKAEKNATPLRFDDFLSITPKTGTLICFPGWLWHTVPELENDEERICMSFNLNCIMTVPK